MLTDIRTDGRTYGRTDKPSNRDARTHLKRNRHKRAKNNHVTFVGVAYVSRSTQKKNRTAFPLEYGQFIERND